MRWATYSSAIDGHEHVGLLVGHSLHGLSGEDTLLNLLQSEQLASAGRRALDNPWEIVSLKDVRLLSPIPVPPSIRDFMSFENHVVTSMQAIGWEVDPVWYQQPAFYFTNPAAVVGPYDDIPISPGSLKWDFELEVAAIIGTGGHDISPGDAEQHIGGFTILVDWSARDLQETEMRIGLGPAKGKDSVTSLGPTLVTLDELEPFRKGHGYELAMNAEVNGRQYSSGSWSSLYWSFSQMIAYASRGTTLKPGDVIGSGTVGTGCILELERVHGSEMYPWLVPGDEVTLTVEMLGAVKSTVVTGADVVPL